MDLVRSLRRALYFALGLAIAMASCAPPAAYAYPASGGTEYRGASCAGSLGNAPWESLSAAAATECNRSAQAFMGLCGDSRGTGVVSGLTGSGATNTFTCAKYWNGSLQTTTSYGTPALEYQAAGYTCPGGGTLSGSTCTCGAGETDTGSACVVSSCPGNQVLSGGSCTCDGNANDPVFLSGGYILVTGGSGNDPVKPTETCYERCKVTLVVDGIDLWARGQDNVWRAEYYGPKQIQQSGTGAKCTTNDSTGDQVDDRCPPGQVQGTFMGQTMCLPGQTNSSGTGTGTTTTNHPDGSRTEVEVERGTVTNCNGDGSCVTTITTTTTTTTFNSSNVQTGQSTETKTETKPGDGSELGEFCEKNKDSPICGKGSFSGTCGAFTCDGDAVTCAIALEQHKRNCEWLTRRTSAGAQQSDVETWWDANSKGEGIASSNTDLHKTGTLPTLDQTTRSLSSGALSDLTVEVWNTSITIPFSNLNTYLQYLGYVLMTCALLIAVRIYHKGVVG